MENNRRKLNNNGLSLVELIVVILIIGIISVSVAISASFMYNANVTRAAKNIATAMTQARQETMSVADADDGSDPTKTTIILSIAKDSNENYFAEITRIDAGTPSSIMTRVLGNSQLTIKMGIHTSTGDTVVIPDFDGGEKVEFIFDRGSGAVDSSYIVDASGNKGSDQNFTDFWVEGSSTEQVIIVRGTGRCYRYED